MSSSEEEEKVVPLRMNSIEDALELIQKLAPFDSDFIEIKDGNLVHQDQDNILYQIKFENGPPQDIIRNIKTTPIKSLGTSIDMLHKAKSYTPLKIQSLSGEKSDSKEKDLDDFNQSSKELDLVFAFASPQIFQKYLNPTNLEDLDYKKIELLNQREEFKIIDNTLIESPTAVMYKKVWATMQNFRDVLSAKPKILHFSGHGEQDEGNGDNDFLIIEKEDLSNENLTGKKLKEIFSKHKEEKDKIRLVVVLSCHSQKVGEIFAKAGIDHVV